MNHRGLIALVLAVALALEFAGSMLLVASPWTDTRKEDVQTFFAAAGGALIGVIVMYLRQGDEGSTGRTSGSSGSSPSSSGSLLSLVSSAETAGSRT